MRHNKAVASQAEAKYKGPDLGESMKKAIFLLLGLLLAGQDTAWAKHHRDHNYWKYPNHKNEERQQQSSDQNSDNGEIPSCAGSPQPNNDQVLKWKTSTRSGFTARAFVVGVLVAILTDQGAHLHLEVDLSNRGNARAEHLEVIYNKQFGQVPPLRLGMEVQACGDYITSTEKNNGYPPSPVGAIIHWIHMSPNPNRHPSGFLVIDGHVTGQKDPHDRPNR